MNQGYLALIKTRFGQLNNHGLWKRVSHLCLTSPQTEPTHRVRSHDRPKKWHRFSFSLVLFNVAQNALAPFLLNHTFIMISAFCQHQLFVGFDLL